jgi:predicted nucleic acid-binding protein
LVADARRLLDAYVAGSVDLIAPFAVNYEVPSSIVKAVRKGRINWTEARSSLSRYLSIPLTIVTPDSTATTNLVSRAFEMAQLLRRSYYDSIFVAFVESLDWPLLTADKPLAEAASAVIDVSYLGNLELP